MKNPSQKELIKRHLLLHGQISPMTALNLYGCFRLAARISELRDSGMDISCDTRNGYGIYKIRQLELGI